MFYFALEIKLILSILSLGYELPVFPAKMRPLANAVLQLNQGRGR